VVLPTTAYGEECVSYTSTERRIQLAEKVVEPASGLTPAWDQIARVAQRMGADWKYRAAADVMEEIRRVVPFYSGASYDNLRREYGRQWPCTMDHPTGTRFLFANENGSKRFQFVAVPKSGAARAASEKFPLTLVCGSSLYYWNQNVLIRHSETLRREYSIMLTDYPRGFVEINPEDAQACGVRDNAAVRISSERGTATSTARVTSEVRRGTVFLPYFERELEKQILGGNRDGVSLAPVRIEKEPA
jgi:formate dehydrogenase (coenzyme F420) alpha subunit